VRGFDFPGSAHILTRYPPENIREEHAMEKRPNAVKFKGGPVTLVGPQLKAGDNAPDFKCLNSGLGTVSLGDTGGKVRLFSVVPSLDTPVCSIQTKKFNEQLGAMKDKVGVYTVSLDLPFAQKRFCGAEGITNMQTLSDVHNQSFGQNYGVLIEGLPLPLLTRAVFVVNPQGKITYVEYVPEVTSEPNYDSAMAAVKAAGA
jgi:thioredoxin-dependent peroxiredoxin